MIVKGSDNSPLSADPRLRAGAEAERQMAFYLNRKFASEPSVRVINDLRLVDEGQPEHDGRAGVCQVDHLILHRWGVFIIESKSVVDEVSVRDDGTGGDEWSRRFRGREQGFQSPIQQARRQGDVLRTFLHRHRELLRGRVAAGLRTLSRLVAGSDQLGFTRMPIQVVVAISDRGKITRVRGWREPSAPFKAFVSKADLVPDKIAAEIAAHRAAAAVLGKSHGEYGIWSLSPDELPRVADFLIEHHSSRTRDDASDRDDLHIGATAQRSAPPRTPATMRPPCDSPQRSVTPSPASERPAPVKRVPATASGPTATCKHCGSAALGAMSGRYGYYWKCRDCGANTAMPTACSICTAEGRPSGRAVIRKEGPRYFRACEVCGIEERIWLEPHQA